MTEFDSIDPPTINLPPPPITNPVTAPAISVPPAGIITVPGTNPPVNPVTTPTINPGVTTSPQPSTLPPAGGGGGGGQRWCVAKNGASQAALQSALDYACGIGGADCSTIQQGASCYDPITLQNHASYAFNSYYQKNPVPTSCDFGGTAVVTNVNPSTGSCVYPSSSSSSSPTIPIIPTTPTMQAPVNPTPLSIPTTSSSGSIIPGAVSSPPGFSLDPGTGVGGFGASPPLMNTASVSNYLQPFIILATSMTMGRLMFGV